MAIAQSKTIIHASQEYIFQVTHDYSVRYDWDPFLQKIAFIYGDSQITEGTKVYVKAKSGLGMEVVFLNVTPPIKAAIKMTKGPFFIESFAGSWVTKKVDVNKTEVTFKYSIQCKKWCLSFILNPLAKMYFQKQIQKRLTGLKKYCEQNMI